MKPFFISSIRVTLILLVVLKVVQLFLPESWMAFLTPAFLLYTPILAVRYTKTPVDYLDRSFKQFAIGLAAFLIAALIIFPPYMVAAHYWMLHIFHFKGFSPAPWQALTQYAGYQLLVVALPEEFYFRGFLQTSLNKVWQPRWRILGADLGWGWIIASLIFAFAHSVIHLQWWHFSIFFPALLFGYLRERTGSITAPILFHAFSNCFMNWFAASYF